MLKKLAKFALASGLFTSILAAVFTSAPAQSVENYACTIYYGSHYPKKEGQVWYSIPKDAYGTWENSCQIRKDECEANPGKCTFSWDGAW